VLAQDQRDEPRRHTTLSFASAYGWFKGNPGESSGDSHAVLHPRGQRLHSPAVVSSTERLFYKDTVLSGAQRRNLMVESALLLFRGWTRLRVYAAELRHEPLSNAQSAPWAQAVGTFWRVERSPTVV